MATKTLRLRMEIPYEEFGEERRAGFLEDLAEVAGVPVEEMSAVRFSKGRAR